MTETGEWIRPRLFTSGRMTAIWMVAQEMGYKNLKDFWTEARNLGWDFYDVLDEASP